MTVNYGLFTGMSSRQVISSPTAFELTSEFIIKVRKRHGKENATFIASLPVTCLFSENVCAMSCQPTAEDRQTEVLNLLNGDPVATNCDGRISDTSSPTDEPPGLRTERRRNFISAWLYTTNLVFLIVALLFSFLSALFSVINVIMNPVITIFR